MITLTVHCESELGVDKQLFELTLDQIRELKLTQETRIASPFGAMFIRHQDGEFKLSMTTNDYSPSYSYDASAHGL